MKWFTRWDKAAPSGMVITPGAMDCVLILASDIVEAKLAKQLPLNARSIPLIIQRLYWAVDPAPCKLGSVFGPFNTAQDAYAAESKRTGFGMHSIGIPRCLELA